MGRTAQPGGGAPVSAGRVVVIGGGLAGITAALDCADAGARVTLVEVRPRLGGAAYSFSRDGLLLDNGQHVFLRCCTAYRELLARLGSDSQTSLQQRLRIPVLAPGGQIAWLARSRLPAPLHLVGALARFAHLPLHQRLAAMRAALALRALDPHDPANDQRCLYHFLEAHGQTPDTIQTLWELICRATINLRANETSLASAAFVFQTGLLRDSRAGDIGLARAPLQRIHGEAAASALARAGVEVLLRHRAERIETDHAGRVCAVHAGGRRIAAQAAVLAVPHQRAARLAPDGALRSRAALEALGSSPIINLYVGYRTRVFDHDFAAAVRSPVQYIFDRTAASGWGDGQLLAVSLSAADEQDLHADRQRLQRRYGQALAQLLPAARDARIEAFYVTREPLATFRAAPGSGALRPGPRTGVPGLALAGAWTDTGWPATMEGAVRSGRAAARVALAALGGVRAPTEAVAA